MQALQKIKPPQLPPRALRLCHSGCSEPGLSLIGGDGRGETPANHTWCLDPFWEFVLGITLRFANAVRGVDCRKHCMEDWSHADVQALLTGEDRPADAGDFPWRK